MWKKIAIAGGTIALIAGAAGVAVADTSSGAPTASPSGSGSGKVRPLERMSNFEHGTWITRGSDGADVTHTAFRGAASDITATSITVTAADGAAQSFTIDADTKVHTKAQHQGAQLQAVQTGDTVMVAGTGTGTVTAKQLVDTSR